MPTLVSVTYQAALSISQRGGFPIRDVIEGISELVCIIRLKSNKNFTRGSRRTQGKNADIKRPTQSWVLTSGYERRNSCVWDLYLCPFWSSSPLLGPTQEPYILTSDWIKWFHAQPYCLFMLSTPYPISGRWTWLMLSPSASAPELEGGVHSGIGAPLPITALQYLSLRQLHLHRPAWWEGFGCGHRARWHCGPESVFQMGLWRVGMEREKDISVPRWVLSSLWSFVPSGLAGSQILMGLIWLCVCRKQHTKSWLGHIVVC